MHSRLYQKLPPTLPRLSCIMYLHVVVIYIPVFKKNIYIYKTSPRGLTFTCWGCYSLCIWHKQTELAHSFLLCSYVYFCLYGPFNFISFHKFSRQLSVFSPLSSGFISVLLVLSTICLHGLTFTRWHKPTQLTHSFLFYSCVCFCLYGPFNFISFHRSSRQNSPLSHSFLPVLFVPHWSFQLYISLWKSPSALI